MNEENNNLNDVVNDQNDLSLLEDTDEVIRDEQGEVVDQSVLDYLSAKDDKVASGTDIRAATSASNSPRDVTPKKPQKTAPFIVTFVLSCLGFVAYALLFVIFSSSVFNQDADTAGEALGVIFSMLILLVPVIAAAGWTIIFSFVSCFCKKKAIRIPSIIVLLTTAISFAVVFAILATR